MPAAIANAPSTNAYAPQRNTRAVRVICGQTNAKTPNAIAARPRNTKAHQLLVYTINMDSSLVQIQNCDPALPRSVLLLARLTTDQPQLLASVLPAADCPCSLP